MTFDDGILTIYKAENAAKPGEKPVTALVKKGQHYYGFDTLGISRYFTALQAKQKIECVVNIPGWTDIKATDICALENGEQFKIAMKQQMTDEDGLRITKLSLERIEETYAVKTESDTGNAQKGNG